MSRRSTYALRSLVCCAGLLVVACDDTKAGDAQPVDTAKTDPKGADEKPDAKAGDVEPVDAAKTDPKDADVESDKKSSKSGKTKRDKGDGSAKIGDREWVAESASASVKDGRLRVSISKTELSGEAISRDAFSIKIKDYKGPGDYKSGRFDSNFSGVGFDVERAKAAVDNDGKADDAKVTAQAIDAIKAAEVILLDGLEVHIESETQTEVVGSFKWEPQGTMASKPPITEGKFRAVIRAKK